MRTRLDEGAVKAGCAHGSETCSPPASGNLTLLTRKSGAYLGVRYGLGVLVSFANMLVLTRWIGPHDYGIFVTALGLSGFLASLTRGGIDTYLVRAEEAPTARSYDIANTLVGGLSVALMTGGIAVIPLLTKWYGGHDFVWPYLATLLTIPLAGLAGPATAKLERDLNFRAAAGIELGGQVLALVVGVVLAWRGCGVWAPVIGLLGWQLWAAAGALWAARLMPRIRFESGEARRMLSFGLAYSGSLRVWQLRSLVNPIFVGRFVGAEGVAFVALAIRFAEGLGFIRSAAGRLAIATLSRLQHDRQRFQSVLERALRVQLWSLGPLLCGFAVIAPHLIPPMLGSRWLLGLNIYPFVAAGVLVNSVYNLQASALYVAGRQWLVLQAYAVHVCLLAGGALLWVPARGIVGYGWAEILACGAYTLLHVAGRRFARVSYRQLGWLALVFVLPPFTLLFHRAWAAPLLWVPLLVLLLVKIRGVLRSAVAPKEHAPQPIAHLASVTRTGT